MLWDTAGQEEFDAITKAYYRGAQAAVLAFSTVDRVSFDAIRSWKKKVGNAFWLFFIRVEMMSWAGK
jgi:Ras-related protein Rab-23